MTNGAKVTTETISPGEVYKRLGPISRAASAARYELGEIPIVYVESRGTTTLALLPPWVGKWIEEHPDELLGYIRADEKQRRTSGT